MPKVGSTRSSFDSTIQVPSPYLLWLPLLPPWPAAAGPTAGDSSLPALQDSREELPSFSWEFLPGDVLTDPGLDEFLTLLHTSYTREPWWNVSPLSFVTVSLALPLLDRRLLEGRTCFFLIFIFPPPGLLPGPLEALKKFFLKSE